MLFVGHTFTPLPLLTHALLHMRNSAQVFLLVLKCSYYSLIILIVVYGAAVVLTIMLITCLTSVLRDAASRMLLHCSSSPPINYRLFGKCTLPWLLYLVSIFFLLPYTYKFSRYVIFAVFAVDLLSAKFSSSKFIEGMW